MATTVNISVVFMKRQDCHAPYVTNLFTLEQFLKEHIIENHSMCFLKNTLCASLESTFFLLNETEGKLRKIFKTPDSNPTSFLSIPKQKGLVMFMVITLIFLIGEEAGITWRGCKSS